MIGLDTNILLRVFLKDDVAQSAKVAELFARLGEIGPGYISCITLMEFAWFLRQRIKLTREQIADGIADLLDSEDIILEDEEAVEEVLDVMSRSQAEFADAFIAVRNRNAGCSATFTFDERAAKTIEGMELLA
ncbi:MULTISPECIES: PIN domain-containing protein [Rhizobium]|uniref:Type II toxin-antitoxin system VapC family toxin n=1 Tax=Rhizobium rhododendri TaxID=2506430 RepID=A0ABY8IE10_9HYPH|nr:MULTISPECIES: type II toxin-antitoxin system VapC family toxin [Rhizobium]MBZ5759006.1 type II toxin-antitoxin system VapC family toxin [Rhizobium sp. VS19-DR96]MBZ5764164.1 type II toxin-antitoxin system VapC family toxin [Rhizobium sp. VS19-DR129.2]MBZ5771707.1 type II toxin-antitoxin system VapC family toxin [Rhizobium sp. VS19-DRK62.2]MBZ5783606.1 type II toxin-antitoxin system VapC family toxin [Rhizobium sp. VS19-DR121]MBZ5801720.1 type II toxin-antitoxin system VapC family toxin [Rhi